jgi:hypothetical protein
MWRKPRFLLIFLAALFTLSACNLPKPTEPPDQNAVLTIAAQTVQAQFTLNALLTPQVTFTPLATGTPLPPTSTNTPPNTPSPTPLCDLALFVTDVTVPDGTVFQPGETFVKTWRLKNNGVCTWNSGYQVIFDSGDSLSGPATQALAGTVAPGQSVDLSVTLKAPSFAGAYRSYWKLRNAAGVLIPVANGYQGAAFFVDIKVVLPTSTPTATLTPTPTPTTTPSP